MYLPKTCRRRAGGNEAPGWLKLEGGERFVRYWGPARCRTRQGPGSLIAGLFTAGLVVFTQQAGDFGLFSLAPQGDARLWEFVAIGVACVLLVAALSFAIWQKVRRRTALQSVLTSQRMLFRHRGRVSEFRLGEIARLQQADSNRGPCLQIFLRSRREAAVTMPLRDVATAITEISNQALAADARLG